MYSDIHRYASHVASSTSKRLKNLEGCESPQVTLMDAVQQVQDTLLKHKRKFMSLHRTSVTTPHFKDAEELIDDQKTCRDPGLTTPDLGAHEIVLERCSGGKQQKYIHQSACTDAMYGHDLPRAFNWAHAPLTLRFYCIYSWTTGVSDDSYPERGESGFVEPADLHRD